MTLKTEKFARKPFYIDAVQVTEENLEEVAEWCKGDIETTEIRGDRGGDKFIRVRVHRPLNNRQTQAFPGDWVLYASNGYKVYTSKAFFRSFVKAEETELVHSVEHKKPKHFPGAPAPKEKADDCVG